MSRGPGLIAELMTRWRWLLAGIVVAALAAGTRFVTIGVLPPSIELKHLRHATASTQLLVGQRHTLNSAKERDLYVTGAVPLAQTLSDLMASPAVRSRIAHAAGIPAAQLAVDTPVWNDVVQIQQWPSREKRDSQIIVERVPYRLTIDVEATAPMINVTAQAPTTTQAAALAAGAQKGLSRFWSQLQDATKTPDRYRYQVTQLVPISVSPPGRSGLANIAAFTFVSVLFIWCGAMLFLPRLAQDLRSVRTGAKHAPAKVSG